MSADSQSPSGYKLCPQCRQIYAASVELCPNDNARLIVERRILVGKYILLNRLGSGAGTEVFAAEQPQLGRMVAIKLLPRDPEFERQFDSQVRSVGTVKHEHVVTLYDSGRAEDGRPYIAMEYLEGENLAERLVRSGALAGERALIFWRQAVSAIAAAHRRHIVHGNLKPANLFLTHRESDDGPQEIVKVIDFHIGPQTPPVSSDTASDGGPSPYLAPEQLPSGKATTRSDVYALGLVLLEMLNGRLPKEGAAGGKAEISQGLLLQLGQSQPGIGGGIRGPLSTELLSLLGDVLRRDPLRRPVDAGALLLLIRKLPDIVSPAGSSSGIRLDEGDISASLSPPPSQSTEPDWLAGLAGAKKGKDRNSSSGIANVSMVAEVSASVLTTDVLETPDMGMDATQEPEWLTGTMEQKAMVVPRPVAVAHVDTGPTAVRQVVPERGEPFVVSETPQMGVAVLTGLLQQIKDKDKDKDQLSDPVAAAPAPLPPKLHWSRVGLRIFFIVLVFGCLGGGLALLARFKLPLSPGSVILTPDLGEIADGAAGVSGAAIADLGPADLAVSSESSDAGAGSPADLAAPVDAEEAADAIKVRFLYDQDSVTSIECNQESLVAPSSADKHGAGVEAVLRPGGFCKASGPHGSKNYKYETVLQKRPDSSGVRRIRIRMNDPGEGDAPAVKKTPEVVPGVLPKPPIPTNEGGGS